MATENFDGHHSGTIEQQLLLAAQAGTLATAVMEIFLRATDPFVHHKVNSAWMQGTSLGLPPDRKSTLVPGYLIYFSGGITFAYLYQRFVPTKAAVTGIAYALIFPLSVVNGLIVAPITGAFHPLVKKKVIPKPGVFSLGLGARAVTFTMLSHIVYGATLGWLTQRQERRLAQPATQRK